MTACVGCRRQGNNLKGKGEEPDLALALTLTLTLIQSRLDHLSDRELRLAGLSMDDVKDREFTVNSTETLGLTGSLVLGLGLAKLKFKGAPCAGLFFSKVSSTHANSLSTRSHVAPGGGWCLHLSLAQP